MSFLSDLPNFNEVEKEELPEIYDFTKLHTKLDEFLDKQSKK